MNLEEKLSHYRLSLKEYDLIKNLLGRNPEGLEWTLFSALWSEHCSYKSSKKHLKKFNFKSKKVLEGFGENAGILDLGLGEKIAFKIESHNHPSFIEPFQGAATGVGGILRDIFSMGARPIALANYLCFGELKDLKMKSLLEGVVGGISHYGNCVGVPNITGQTEFHNCYDKNILVNAFALGYLGPKDKIFTSRSFKPGCLVVYVGAQTGRDGVHGASMASESFSGDEKDKTTVQIGDPFFEKLLIESSLEVMSLDLVEAVQDMGAAGLTSSTFEMSAKSGYGLSLHLDKVPLRDSSMSAEDILLSESQERMIFMVLPENFETLCSVFLKSDLEAVCIGEVSEDKKIKLFWDNKLLNEIDPCLIVDHAPEYDRDYEVLDKKAPQSKDVYLKVLEPEKTILNLLSHPLGTTRSWIFNQYDQRVGAKTAQDASYPVGALKLPHSQRDLGVVLGGRPYVMNYNSYQGGLDSVFYPSLELASKGFKALAVTDCLNFGSPEKKQVMSDFVATIDSMKEMCELLDTPVISGNVSFYNETLGKNIIPTPVTAVVGLKENKKEIVGSYYGNEESIYLLSLPQVHLSGLFAQFKKEKMLSQGFLNPKDLVDFYTWILKSSQLEGVKATRVVGKLGLIYTLCRFCLIDKGAHFKINRPLEELFGERLYEVVFCVDQKQEELWLKQCQSIKKSEFLLTKIGESCKDNLVIESDRKVHLDTLDIFKNYFSSEDQFEILA